MIYFSVLMYYVLWLACIVIPFVKKLFLYHFSKLLSVILVYAYLQKF